MPALDALRGSELFAGLDDGQIRRFEPIGRERSLKAGEILFRLGDDADDLYSVVSGKMELTFPIRAKGERKDVRFQAIGEGRTLAWSALVSPHKLTMGARAAVDSTLLAFAGNDLVSLFGEDPRIGFLVMTNLSNVIGARLRETQALWAREIQRHVSRVFR